MGPLAEFERRFLDVTQQRRFLLLANAGGPPPEQFAYPLTFGSAAVPLTNGVTFQKTIAMQADAYFLWMYLSAACTIPLTAGFGGPDQFTDASNLLLQIGMPGMGDELFNLPAGFAGAPAANCAGTPTDNSTGIPLLFPTPVLLPPNTNVNVSVQKYGTNAGADNPDMTGAYVLLAGFRIPVWS